MYCTTTFLYGTGWTMFLIPFLPQPCSPTADIIKHPFEENLSGARFVT